MKCPIDVEKKVAEMRQELHPDALVEDAYRAILGAMNGAYCDGLQGKGAPGDLAAAISDAERSLGEFAGVDPDFSSMGTVLETTRWTPLPCEASKPPPVSTMFNC